MDMQVRRGPVSVGVLLDSRVQEHWVAEAVRLALAVPGVSLGAVAVMRGAAPRRRARLFGFVDGLDRRLHCRGEPLFASADVTGGLDTPVFEVDIARAGDGWSLDADAAERLSRCQVDVWLCFAKRPARRPLARIASRGIWCLELGRETPAVHEWAGAAEIGASCPVTMVGIADYMRPPGADLYRTYGSTIRSSVRRNRLCALRKGMRLFARLLAGMARDGNGWQPPRHALVPVPANYPGRRPPTPPAVVRLCGRIATTVATNRLARLRWREQWQIGYFFLDGRASKRGTLECRYLVPPPRRIWADPFVAENDGRHYIFFEDLAENSERGRIMAVEVFRDADPGPAQVALEQPYHLSYPFIFRWNGAIYMLPETGANRSVELYRCEEFPLRWRRERVLIEDVAAYDATLWNDGDRWWMFVNVAEPGADCNDELHIYWSATPLGPWTAHRANPVVTDVRCARSAGPLFTCAGSLYRPSQDSSRVYGEAVSINRIDVLNEDEYRELPVNRIDPGRRDDVRGVHTFGGTGSLGVIDLLVKRSRW